MNRRATRKDGAWMARLLARTQKTQRDLEEMFGLSAGYLSKVKSGAREPSILLVTALELLVEVKKLRLDNQSLKDDVAHYSTALLQMQQNHEPRDAAPWPDR